MQFPMFSTLSVFLGLLLFIPLANSTTTPPSIPLAVRSPYLSAWLPQGQGAALNAGWPQFWNGDTLGWAGFINVDGTSYSFLGVPAVANTHFKPATQESVSITSTQSTFVMNAGPVQLTVTFLSPVEPSDLVNQSLPFSYMAMSVVSPDGSSHKVQLYTDISAEWTSGNDNMIVNWTTSATGGVVTHQVQLENQTLFADVADRIQQGSAYYTTIDTPGLTWQTGQDIVVRAQFINNSVLLNTSDTNFRGISDDWPVFAFCHDFGTVSGTSDTFVVAIGHVRDPAIEYVVAGNATQNRSLYFWTRYSTVDDVISTFLDDFSNAMQRAQAFDSKVAGDAGTTAYPPNYLPIVEWSIRQAFGGIEITVSKDDSTGAFNTSDVTAFVKEISSSGRASTTDVIYTMWPIFLYTNPALGKAAIAPLLEYQANGLFPNPYACHDLGVTYPKAIGYPSGDGELSLPVEESSNMLIMTLSYTQRSNDISLISQYYKLLNGWAEYLVVNTLAPASQFSTDVFAGALANQTNLAVKGMIAIKAMSEMATIAGDGPLSGALNSTAQTYVQEWQTLADASDDLHYTLSYGNSSSWSLLYNLYADKLLQTNLIPQSVYQTQNDWLAEQTNQNKYGIELDTRHNYTLSGWETWTAAIVTDSSVRTQIVNLLYGYATNGVNSGPFSDWYDTESGKCVEPCFRARPVVGANLALLALQSTETSPDSPTSGGNSATGTTKATGSPSPTKKSSAERASQAQFELPTVAMMFIVTLALVCSGM